MGIFGGKKPAEKQAPMVQPPAPVPVKDKKYSGGYVTTGNTALGSSGARSTFLGGVG